MTTRRRAQGALGRRIVDLRIKGNITQQQLAALARLSIDGLKGVEQGRRQDPRLSTVRRVAAAFGLSVDELLGEADLPPD